jgi:hypothetical protein
VFAQEYEHRDTTTAFYGQQRADFASGITIHETKVDLWRSVGEMIKKWAVVDAIATPSSRQVKNLLSARKTSESIALFSRERKSSTHSLPAIAQGRVGTTVKEQRAWLSFRKHIRPIDHGDPRDEPFPIRAATLALTSDFLTARSIMSNPAE